MNSKYRILCVEDNDDAYDSVDAYIKLMFRKRVCVNPDLSRAKSVEEAKQLNLYSYDLIVIDYNLDGDLHGSELVKMVKQMAVLSRVIFYSSDDYDKLNSSLPEGALFGVKLSNRDDLADVIIDEAEAAVFTKLDYNGLRGYFLDGVANLEVIMNELINLCELLDLNADLPFDSKKYFEVYKTGILSAYKANTRKIISISTSSELRNSKLFDMDKRRRWTKHLLDEVMNNFQATELKAYLNTTDDYAELFKSEIQDTRNALAHQSLDDVQKLYLDIAPISEDQNQLKVLLSIFSGFLFKHEQILNAALNALHEVEH